MAQPLTLYCRDSLVVRKVIDPSSSLNVNAESLVITNDLTYLASDGITYTSTGFLESTIYPSPSEQYTALQSDIRARAQIHINNLEEKDLYEISLDAVVLGPGKFRFSINGNDLETIYGDCPLKTIPPHRFEKESKVFVDYECLSLDCDPDPYSAIDNICCYSYIKINADISNYSPIRTSVTNKQFNIIRGSRTYQNMQNLSAECEFDLVFYTEEEHTNFLINGNKIYAFCDEKGHVYRGILELGELKKIAKGIYYQKVKFQSSDIIGVGWL